MGPVALTGCPVCRFPLERPSSAAAQALIFGHRRLGQLDDPAGLALDEVPPIRDDIRRRVERLLASLDLPAATARGRILI